MKDCGETEMKKAHKKVHEATRDQGRDEEKIMIGGRERERMCVRVCEKEGESVCVRELRHKKCVCVN